MAIPVQATQAKIPSAGGHFNPTQQGSVHPAASFPVTVA